MTLIDSSTILDCLDAASPGHVWASENIADAVGAGDTFVNPVVLEPV